MQKHVLGIDREPWVRPEEKDDAEEKKPVREDGS